MAGAGQRRRLPRFVIPVALLAFGLDQGTKIWVRENIPFGGGFEVGPGWFNMVHVGNTGAAFGMFAGGNTGFIALSCVALAVLSVLAWRGFFARPVMAWACALLVGGILGNALDRVLVGHVTDFLDFYVGEHHWPAFNVADSCICAAAGLMLIAEFFGPRGGGGPAGNQGPA